MLLDDILNERRLRYEELDKNEQNDVELELKLVKEEKYYVLHDFINGKDFGRHYTLTPEEFVQLMTSNKDGSIDLNSLWNVFEPYFITRKEIK